MTANRVGRLRRAAAAFIIGVSAMTALMPPGLCACWINPSVQSVHIHLGAPTEDHSHADLSDSADGVAPFALLLPLPNLQSLILLALAGVIWTPIAQAFSRGTSWSHPPGLPPPKTRSL
jgi:hypothetical protein